MFCHFKYCPLSNKVDTLENRFIAAVYELCVSQVLSTVLRAVCEYFPCHKIGGMREPGRELPGTGQVLVRFSNPLLGRLSSQLENLTRIDATSSHYKVLPKKN